jgi:hypothetical protein
MIISMNISSMMVAWMEVGLFLQRRNRTDRTWYRFGSFLLWDPYREHTYVSYYKKASS